MKLPPELAKYVAEKVESGKCASADDVLIRAVRVMKNVEEWLPAARDELRRELEIGLEEIDAGLATDWDVEEMKRDLLEYSKRRGAS